MNEELYDAARVDGCGRWKRIWHVTLPGITPVVTIMLIMAAGNLVSDNFDQVFNLLNPAVYSTGDVLGTYIIVRASPIWITAIPPPWSCSAI